MIPAASSAFINGIPATNSVVIAPNLITQVGSTTVTAHICDSWSQCNLYSFVVNILAPLPYFINGGPMSHTMNVLSIFQY